MQTSDFKDLRVWKMAMDITIEVYKAIKALPSEERYALSDQIRRCAISVPSNIAEGQARHTNKDFIHFLAIARGSVAEIQTQIIICDRLNYIDSETCNSIINEYSQIDRMLSGLMKSLSK